MSNHTSAVRLVKPEALGTGPNHPRQTRVDLANRLIQAEALRLLRLVEEIRSVRSHRSPRRP